MKSFLVAILFALATTSCIDIPDDTEGSLHRIRDAGAFRVGLIAGSQDEGGRARRLIEGVAREVGATPQIATGPAEPLLIRLEEGELDLVVGSMARKSPWALKVHVLSPLSPAAEKRPTRLVALARNGENAWISLLHRHVEQIRAER